MAFSFEYNAPTYINFEDPNPVDDSDGADIFFDVETEIQSSEKENVKPTTQTSAGASPANISQLPTVKSEAMTPQDSNAVLKDGSQPEKISSNSKRRSLLKAARRMSNIKTEESLTEDGKKVTDNFPQKQSSSPDNLSDSLTKLSVKSKKHTHFEGIPIEIKEEKPHSMTTRADTALNALSHNLRSREVVKEKTQSRKRKGDQNLEVGSHKYIGLAENILHFQNDTPPRFHSHRSNTEDKHRELLKKRQSYRPGPTVAKTPKLLTRIRARPSVLPSQAEREASAFEEARRHQVKAQPLNEKIFHPPQPVKKSTRQSTVVQPFHLTEMVKKPIKTETEVFQFKARPLPKRVLQGPTDLGAKPEIPLTVPESPAITKRPTRHAVTTWTAEKEVCQENVVSFGVPMSQNKLAPLQNTVVKPFSFEVRDKMLMEKKERKIQEYLEEEKKARQFKAKPAPMFLPPSEAHTSKCSIASSAVDVSQTSYQFRARSPKVLRVKPFEPIKEGKHSVPMEVALNTEKRAVERQDFELKMMDREERFALFKEQAEMEKKEKEAQEIARLRKEATHKANPMPTYPPPPKKVNSDIRLTEPKSPIFTKRSKHAQIDKK